MSGQQDSCWPKAKSHRVYRDLHDDREARPTRASRSVSDVPRHALGRGMIESILHSMRTSRTWRECLEQIAVAEHSYGSAKQTCTKGVPASVRDRTRTVRMLGVHHQMEVLVVRSWSELQVDL